MGYLPEERGLYRKMTVTDQLAFLAELHGLKRRQALPVIESWLQRVGLAEWAKKKVDELSKGMQQKIQLVGTVLHEPDHPGARRTLLGPRPDQPEPCSRNCSSDYKRAGQDDSSSPPTSWSRRRSSAITDLPHLARSR